MVEGRTDALQLIIEQRDQILAEKNSKLKMKTSEVDAFAAQVSLHDCLPPLTEPSSRSRTAGRS
jgi:hypothetical protein